MFVRSLDLETTETKIKSTADVHHAKSLRRVTFEREECRILGFISIKSGMPRKCYWKRASGVHLSTILTTLILVVSLSCRFRSQDTYPFSTGLQQYQVVSS
jgi:hypothetical protein